MNNIKDLLKNSFRLLLIVVLSTFATSVASAKTISNSVNFADSTRLDYFENLYLNSEYKNYLLSIESISSGYSSYSYYYICLTNSDIEISSSLSASSSCDKMYTYYRDSNSNYVLSEYNDNNLVVNNSVYYVSNNDKLFFNEKLLIGLNIGVLTFLLTYVFLKIFRS